MNVRSSSLRLILANSIAILLTGQSAKAATGDLTGTSYVTMTAVPEPGAELLGGLGFLALLLRRRD